MRGSLQAAFAAVKSSDVLESDFSSLEEALSPRISDDVSLSTRNGSGARDGVSDDREPRFAETGPPKLSKGDDDIFWMSQLHGALLQVCIPPTNLVHLSCTQNSTR